MKTITVLILTFTFGVFSSKGQNTVIDHYFGINPTDIQSESAEGQRYDVTLKWQNLQALSGVKINCNAVNATYIVEPNNEKVRWKNVSLAHITDFSQKTFSGAKLPAFDQFTYKAIDTAFLSEKFYEKIPADQRDLAKWLVSDAIQMQGLAWYIFDSLEYKEEFVPELLSNYDIKFEDWVTFTSRYQKLKWTGISEHNGEVCAIVEFESYYNPVKIDNEQMKIKGRSLYYGQMWVSLKDKQVEYAKMFEDVIMEINNAMFPEPQLIDLQREIVFNKQK